MRRPVSGCGPGCAGGRRRLRRAAPVNRGRLDAMETFRMLIGGKAVDAQSGQTFTSLNPYTGQGWAGLPDAGTADIDTAVAAARSALDGEWGSLTGFARAALLRRLGDLVIHHAERLARLEVQD